MLVDGWIPRPIGRQVRIVFVSLVAIAASLTAADWASADELCVGLTAGCVSTYNYPGDSAGLQQALDDAASGAHPLGDTIHLAAGVYESATGFSADSAGGLSISHVDAGTGAAVLRATGLAASTLAATSSPNSLGLSGISVESNAALAGAVAIETNAFVNIQNARVTCIASSCTGLSVASGVAATVTKSIFAASAAGSVGVELSGTGSSDSVFTTTRFAGFATALDSTDRDVVVRSSLIDLGWAPGAVGVSLDVSAAISTRLAVVDGSTIIGEGAGQVGISTLNDSDASDSTLYARSTAVDLSGSGSEPFYCDELDVGEATLTTVGSAFDTSVGSMCTESHATPLDVKTFPPAYVNRAARDLRPLHSSSFVDRGEPYASYVGNYGAYDLSGEVRKKGTNIDIGAFEYQYATPKIAGEISISRSGRRNNDVIASVSVTDEDPDAFSYAWTIDGQPIPGGQSATATLSYAKYGSRATFKVTVTDPTGRSDSDSETIDVFRAPKLIITAITSTRRLVLSSVKNRFGAGNSRPKNGRFAFDLNTEAELTFTFTRLYEGFVGKRGRCDTSRKVKRGRRCTNPKTLTNLKFTKGVEEGKGWIAVGGRVGSSRLKPGLYSVIIKATGESGIGYLTIQMRLRK